ncbi:MAG: cell wall hydrolase [Alphaproteobacteria bacterium]|nr:cell wall hydrolase [Alphaproteobacteria bacterium]
MFTKGSIVALATILLALAFPGESRGDVVEDLNCLALNIYFEARSEPLDGKLAVGHVVLNRTADSHFPDKICEVVKQGGAKRLNKCQFSWWCDGRSDRPRNPRAWEESQVLARLVYWGYSTDPTGGALWYHADYVKPYWRTKLDRGPMIGRHQFYLPAGSLLVDSVDKKTLKKGLSDS